MTAITAPQHRVSVVTAQMRELAASVIDASLWSMDPHQTGTTLVELTRLRAQIDELQSRVAAHAGAQRVGEAVGASSAAAWLARETASTRATAYRAERLGHALQAHPATRTALAAGEVLADQARAIVRSVEALPDTLDRTQIEEAERHLLALARDHDAAALIRLGRRTFEVIVPEEADAREAATLAKEEAAAARATHLTMWHDGHGQTHGRFTIPTVHGAVLRKMLRSLAAPRHVAATRGSGADRPPTAEAMGRAFCELIERYPAKRLPKTGGLSATMVVLIEEDALLGRLERAGMLDTGDRISPAMARRLACEAGLVPVVLGGRSQPLDIGRKRRLFTEYQRIAMLVRDRGCVAEGCDRTVGLHAHHTTRWADGGRTDLADGVSLCHWHHTKAHDPRYHTTYLPTGKVRFHRRT